MINRGYPLATSTWDQNEYKAIDRVVQGGRFTMGPLVRQFEESFASEFGSRFAVMVNSGSSANLLLIAAAVLNPEINLRAGDEVIVPAVSWATTYYPLQQYGLIPVFVDIDIDTLNFDLSLVAEAITPRTRAIFAVNLLGNPNDFEVLNSICLANNLLLLEDNCESLGAKFNDKATGTFGLGGTFSSFYSHHISTMEGGLVVTDDERTYQTMISMRAHGWTRELPDENLVFPKSGDAFEDLFRFVLPGYNLRPLEMSGSIGLEQLKKVPQLIAGRRSNAEHFQNIFGSVKDIRIQQEVGESSWFGFSMVLEGGLSGRRAEVVQAFSEAGIDSRPIVAGNFSRNPVMAYLNAIVPEELPAADKIHSDGLFVGNHHYDVTQGIDFVFDVLESVKR